MKSDSMAATLSRERARAGSRLSPPSTEESTPDRRRAAWPLYFLLCVAWIALFDSVYLLLLESSLAPVSFLCDGAGGCLGAVSSRYGRVLGVPLSVLGIGYYAGVAGGVSALLAISCERPRRWIHRGLKAATAVGIAASAYLMTVQLLLLEALCPLCTVSAVASAVLVVAVWRWRVPVGSSGSIRLPVFVNALAVTLLLVGGVAVVKAGERDVVASIDGRKLLRSDMERDLGYLLADLRTQEYRLQKSWVDSRIRRELLRVEALSRGVDPIELANAEVERRLDSAGETAAETSGLEAGALNGARSDDARQRTEKALGEFFDELRATHDVTVRLEEPKRRTVQLDPKLARFKGNPEARYVFTVFADFECPMCAQVSSSLESLQARLSKDVAVAFRHYPLKGHEQARLAAVAAECAAEQGRFWEYHDRLFDRQADLGPESLLARARELGLDVERFRRSLESEAAAAVVDASKADGARFGIRATPTIFLNGEEIGGALTLDELTHVLAVAMRKNRPTEK